MDDAGRAAPPVDCGRANSRGAARHVAGQDNDGHAATRDDAAEHSADRPITLVGAIGALGIVYGDLGTSPLYTYQTIVGGIGGHPTAQDALGLLSLVVWALIVTVSVKYCVFVMRADNHGEGGILALLALITGSRRARTGRGASMVIAAGLFGAALIYGDGIITPAISVLSALEGVNVATDTLKPYVLPAAMTVLVALFAVQAKGTAKIGRIFGPLMLLWFVVIAVMGAMATLRHPQALLAINPTYAAGFLIRHGLSSLVVLGGVFLAITGGEALYADMGHLGRRPIRASWYGVVLPALLLAYSGQTALLMEDPNLEGNPFFRMAPGWAVVPLVVLATLATIIASQAIITGVFSLTRQAIQLGYFPGLTIHQTSDREYGQIYVPLVNWTMMLCTVALTFAFGSSDRLAGAYGTAVSTTMLLTTALLYNAMRDVWGWRIVTAALTAACFLLVDGVFFAANLLKLPEGGWVPLLLGGLVFIVMTTWRRGIDAMHERQMNAAHGLADFIRRLQTDEIARVSGTAVFFSRADTRIPNVLVRHVEQFKVLQEKVVTLTVNFDARPRVSQARRARVEQVAENFWHITVHFGFVEIPSVAAALACARDQGCPLDLNNAIYIAEHDEVVQSKRHPRLAGWRRMLFAVMYRNSVRMPDRFDLQVNRFIEVGRQIGL